MLIITPIPAFGRQQLNIWIDHYLTTPCSWIRNLVFPKAEKFNGFFTDSLNYIILLFLAICFGLVVKLLLSKLKVSHYTILQYSRISISYYLAWIFLVYGFSKLFGAQFPSSYNSISTIVYSKENIDIMFWEQLGRNQILVYFIGSLEISIATMLLIKKSRNLGLVLFFISMLVIVGVNVYYDISVKVFSSLLLLAATIPLFNENPHFTPSKSINYLPIKLFVASFLFISAIYTSKII